MSADDREVRAALEVAQAKVQALQRELDQARAASAADPEREALREELAARRDDVGRLQRETERLRGQLTAAKAAEAAAGSAQAQLATARQQALGTAHAELEQSLRAQLRTAKSELAQARTRGGAQVEEENAQLKRELEAERRANKELRASGKKPATRRRPASVLFLGLGLLLLPLGITAAHTLLPVAVTLLVAAMLVKALDD